MKKIVCILLTLVMVMSLSVVAFADNGNQTLNDGSGSKEITVTGKITKDTEVGKSEAKYEITIEWTIGGSENGTKIQKTSGYTWNPTSYKYELDSTDPTYAVTGSDTIGGTITVTNKSNADIGYTIAWTDSTSLPTGVTVTETSGGVTNTKLARADQAFVNASAVEDDYNITPDKLDGVDGEATVGTYSVSLSWSASEYSTLYNDNSITLGKYTVTIGAAPTN